MRFARTCSLLVAVVAAIAASPAVARKPEPPVPLTDAGSWIRSEDYPKGSLRRANTGITSFRVTVGIDGKVSACEVTVSSGWAALDEATCRLVAERARFTPAKDRKGRPVTGVYENRVRWQIPDDKPNPETGLMVWSALIGPDGNISDCRIEQLEGDAVRDRKVGPMPECPIARFGKGYVDTAGGPAWKRVRYTMRVDVLDATDEVPSEAPAAP